MFQNDCAYSNSTNASSATCCHHLHRHHNEKNIRSGRAHISEYKCCITAKIASIYSHSDPQLFDFHYFPA